MNHNFDQSVSGYRSTDGCTIIQYALDSAASFTEVRRLDNPIELGGVGVWRGASRDIVLIPTDARMTGEEYEKQYVPLLTAAAIVEDLSISDCLTVYINIIRLIATGKERDIMAAFRENGYQIHQMTQPEYFIWLNHLSLPVDKLTAERRQQIGFSEEESNLLDEAERQNINSLPPNDEESVLTKEIPSPILYSLLGVYVNLITKKLTGDNEDKWYRLRIAAYKNSNLADGESVLFTEYKPTLNFSNNINNSMPSCFSFKRLVFVIVKSISQSQSHPLCETAKITMIYYRFSELTAFGMVVEYILTRNPVLLSWNGIARLVPQLKSAVDKYRSLGSDAPYCKLIYPPEDLIEFQSSRLGIWTSIAYDIAGYEGKRSLKNYKGAGDTNLTLDYSIKCREIINYYSGAITRSVAHTRTKIFHTLDPESDLAKLLNSETSKSDQDETAHDNNERVPGVNLPNYIN